MSDFANNSTVAVRGGSVQVIYNGNVINQTSASTTGYYNINVSLMIFGYHGWPNGRLPVKVVFSIPYGPSQTVEYNLTEFQVNWLNETMRFNGSFSFGKIVISLPPELSNMFFNYFGVSTLSAVLFIVFHLGIIGFILCAVFILYRTGKRRESTQAKINKLKKNE